ncbi:MAG TPA: hypothetical protein VNI02_08375 [Blastocatellia bacterium]|nr:hypothetical protein [Blastocatellia bacterium]
MMSRARHEIFCEKAALWRLLARVFAARNAASANRATFVTLFAALAFVLALPSPALSQQTKILTPIDATSINPRIVPTYRFNFDKGESYDAHLDIEGDGLRWRAVKFHQIPGGMTLRVDGQPMGYINSELLVEGKWYPFKKRLSLVITIPKSARLPAELAYELNFVKVLEEGTTVAQARELLRSEDSVEAPQPLLRIGFQRGNEAPVSSPVPTPEVSPEPLDRASPEDSSVTWLQVIPFIIVSMGLGALLLLIWLSRGKSKQREAARLSSRHAPLAMDYQKLSDRTSRAEASLNQSQGGDYRPLAPSFPGFGRKRKEEPLHGGDIFASEATNLSEAAATGQQDKATSAKYIPAVPPPAPPTEVPRKPSMPPMPPVTSDHAARWTPQSPPIASPGADNSREAQRLSQETEGRLSGHAAEIGKLKFANQTLEKKIDGLKAQLDAQSGRQDEIKKMLAQLKNELSLGLTQDLDVIVSHIAEQQQQIQQAQKCSENALKYMQEQVRHFDEKVKAQAAEFEQREKEQHETYSVLLGDVLGLNVETLREGTFEGLVQAAGKNLDRFFQEQVPDSDGLTELQEKAEAISSVLETIVEKALSIKPDTRKFQLHVERAKRLASELGKLRAQLQGRKVGLSFNMAFPLRVPVGTYQGARETFLEELGKAVKREIDKLRDPRRYWSNELERFAASDVVAVADICDRDITGRPGTNKELEQSLNELFRQAGLRSVVPEQGTEFKPAEQHLTQMVAGSPNDSQKIKKVVGRGFYQAVNGKERLIRKAGVEIYR